MTTEFIQSAIREHLGELRHICAEKRHHLSIRPSQLEDIETNPQTRAWLDWAQQEIKNADSALAAFIAEHRPFMPGGWIDNNHGRLCWNAHACFSRTSPPIAEVHYCDWNEGHDGAHSNHLGAWH